MHTSTRNYDLDWLRAGALGLLILFHSAMPFVAEWDWHIRNAETSNVMLELSYFVSRFRMSLLFLIAGAASWFAFGKYGVGGWVRERGLRLGIPLLFGILVVVPPQIYFERQFAGGGYSNFFEFYPTVFTSGPYPSGNLSWHHLWFLAYLLIYVLALAPLLAWLRSSVGRRRIDRLAMHVERRGAWLLGAPMVLTFAVLILKFPGPQNVVSDLAMLLVYAGYFIVGYVLCADPRFFAAIARDRRHALRAGFFLILTINALRWNRIEPEWGYTPGSIAFLVLLAVNAWCWLLAILGYARHYFNRDHRWRVEINRAVYPLYVLHQTVTVILAYYLVQTADPLLLKYGGLVLGTVVVSLGLYAFAIRPYRLPRILFGMSVPGRPDQAQAQATTASPASRAADAQLASEHGVLTKAKSGA